jgi:hypothetical protein
MKKMYLLLVAIICFTGYCQGQPKMAAESFDTISFTDKDGTDYKLISMGDKVPRLFVNGSELSRKELEGYANMVDQLQKELFERQQKIRSEKSAQKGKDMDVLAKQLVADGILSSTEALTKLLLDEDNFIVNDKKQSWAALAKYIRLFSITSQNCYHFNTK